MFFKKKTPFTQFVNASYAGGVFFNPPVAGIWNQNKYFIIVMIII